MSEDAAILAQFSDWRTVKGRKVLQLIFEVPLEDQAKVLTHLGAPMPMADLWCGIARVARKGKAGDGPTREDGRGTATARSSPAANSVTPVGGETGGVVVPSSLASPPVPKPKRRWSEMPPSQRAALLCADEEFQRWATLHHTGPAHANKEDVTAWLREACGVTSRKQLDGHDDPASFNPHALSRFRKFESDFEAWRQARGHGVI